MGERCQFCCQTPNCNCLTLVGYVCHLDLCSATTFSASQTHIHTAAWPQATFSLCPCYSGLDGLVRTIANQTPSITPPHILDEHYLFYSVGWLRLRVSFKVLILPSLLFNIRLLFISRMGSRLQTPWLCLRLPAPQTASVGGYYIIITHTRSVTIRLFAIHIKMAPPTDGRRLNQPG